jgi:hypothetical protein
MNVYMFFLIFMSICYRGIVAQTIVVHNQTPTVMYGAVYHLDAGHRAKRVSTVYELIPGQAHTLNRSNFQKTTQTFGGPSLVLFVSYQEQDISPIIERSHVDRLVHITVNALRGKDFFVTLGVTGNVLIYDRVTQAFVQPFDTRRDALAVTIGQTCIARHREDAHQHEGAHVAVGAALSSAEADFTRARKLVNRDAWRAIGGPTFYDHSAPTIALVCSGGGYRAMAYTAGTIRALAHTGLWDTITWVVGLSGSTWALNILHNNRLTPDALCEHLANNMSPSLEKLSSTAIKEMLQSLICRASDLTAPCTFVDIYGCGLANRLFVQQGYKRYAQRLSDQATLSPDQYALPIYTAISTGQHKRTVWLEYTPYQIGSPDYGPGLYIPTWSIGRKFDHGVSTSRSIEPHLGFHLGTFGSAFSARFSELLGELKSKIESKLLMDLFQAVVERTASESLLSKRVPGSWAQIWNYTYGMPESPIKDQAIIKLSDAGLDFNLPYPPISGRRPDRKADIIIFLDMSEDMKEPTALIKSAEYAQRYGLPFPKVSDKDLTTRALSVLYDPAQPDVPMVLYMPRVQDPELYQQYAQDPEYADILSRLKGFDLEKESTKGFCQVGNLNYTPEQARLLMDAADFTMRAVAPQIIAAVRKWQQNRQGGISAIAPSPSVLVA